jgi:hypothetical protein
MFVVRVKIRLPGGTLLLRFVSPEECNDDEKFG